MAHTTSYALYVFDFYCRGSSSDKIFTVLLVLCAVAGFLGSVRWHAIGDATYTEALLWYVERKSYLYYIQWV